MYNPRSRVKTRIAQLAARQGICCKWPTERGSTYLFIFIELRCIEADFFDSSRLILDTVFGQGCVSMRGLFQKIFLVFSLILECFWLPATAFGAINEVASSEVSGSVISFPMAGHRVNASPF